MGGNSVTVVTIICSHGRFMALGFSHYTALKSPEAATGFWDVLRPEAAEFIGEVIFCPGGDAEAMGINGMIPRGFTRVEFHGIIRGQRAVKRGMIEPPTRSYKCIIYIILTTQGTCGLKGFGVYISYWADDGLQCIKLVFCFLVQWQKRWVHI